MKYTITLIVNSGEQLISEEELRSALGFVDYGDGYEVDFEIADHLYTWRVLETRIEEAKE